MAGSSGGQHAPPRLSLGAALALAGGALLLFLAAQATPAEAQSAKYVATGNAGTVVYSIDGITWNTAAGFPTATCTATISGPFAGGCPLWAVGHNGTHWVAAAMGTGPGGNAGLAFVSTDGINWATYTTPMGGVGSTWGGATWGSGRWVIAGAAGQVATSTTGTSWAMATYPGGIGNILGTTYAGGLFMTTGNSGAATSPDGVTWTATTSPGITNMRASWLLGGTWHVASGTSAATRQTTNNGVSWTPGPAVGPITKFAYDGMGTYVAVGGTSAWTSPDMVTWTLVPGTPFTGALYGVTYGDCLFVAAGYNGNIATSPDGLSWTLRSGAGSQNMYAVATSAKPGCGPRANDEAYVFNEDQGAKPLPVLANDVAGLSGAPFAIVGQTTPTKGLLTGPVNGVYTYQPYPNANGADSFVYTVQDTDGKTDTATVTITINAVNDAPDFQGGDGYIQVLPLSGMHVVPGWATGVTAGPAGVPDEEAQGVVFVTTQNTVPAIFASQPSLARSGTAGSSVPAVPPTSGAYGVLTFAPSVLDGSSTVCFKAVDSGGVAVATNSWGESVAGDDDSDEACVEVATNASPIAYFETDSPRASTRQASRSTRAPAPCRAVASTPTTRSPATCGSSATARRARRRAPSTPSARRARTRCA
jgi:hypothetical protein